MSLHLVAKEEKVGRVTRERRLLTEKIRYVVQEYGLLPLPKRALPKNSISPLVWGGYGAGHCRKSLKGADSEFDRKCYYIGFRSVVWSGELPARKAPERIRPARAWEAKGRYPGPCFCECPQPCRAYFLYRRSLLRLSRKLTEIFVIVSRPRSKAEEIAQDAELLLQGTLPHALLALLYLRSR